MAQDFTYRGVHIGTLGLHYAPETPDWHIWEGSYTTSESSSDTKDGSQWNFSTADSKELNLRLYFEDITDRQLFDGIELFTRRSKGELIFDERPWLVYSVRPYKEVKIEKYKSAGATYSGTMTVHLKAYYPFAVSLFNVLEDNTAYISLNDRLRDTTGILPSARMPVNATGTKTAQFIYNAYNGGNARADTIIKIAGDVGSGVDIYNMATGQYCRVIGLTAANTTSVNKWLEIKSYNGECYLTNGTAEENGYRYHDRGFIQLASGTPLIRDVSVTYNGNSLTSATALFLPTHVGRVIGLGGTWHEIMSITSPTQAIINPVKAGPATVTTDLTNLNRLVVTPLTTMSLTRFEVEYKHTFK